MKIHAEMVEKNETIPDQKGQPTQTPTMRRLAQMFEGVDLLSLVKALELCSGKSSN